MSTDVAPQSKSRKHKEKSEKKSKKRQREEDQTAESSAAAQRSPKKKRTVEDAPSKTTVTPAPAPAPAPALKSRLKRPESESAFFLHTSSLYVPLASIGQSYPLEAICAEHLSPLLLTYHPPFKGVVICYQNARLSEAPATETPQPVLARSVDEYAVSFVWVTVDFVVLRPQKGIWVEGFVNLQNESHLGLVCWNLFSASIDRRRLPEEWTWVEGNDAGNAAQAQNGEGYFVDGDGKKVDGLVKFRIRDFETSPSTDSDRGFITIEGSLLPEDKEAELDEQEQQKLAQRQASRRGKTRARAQGAR